MYQMYVSDVADAQPVIWLLRLGRRLAVLLCTPLGVPTPVAQDETYAFRGSALALLSLYEYEAVISLVPVTSSSQIAD